MPKLNQTILWVHAFVSVTGKYKLALQTLQEYFQLRKNGSKYQVQRVESIINISFAAAAVSPRCGKEQQQQNLSLLYFRPVALGIYYHLFSAGNNLAEFVTKNLYLPVVDTNACTHKIVWFYLGKDNTWPTCIHFFSQSAWNMSGKITLLCMWWFCA